MLHRIIVLAACLMLAACAATPATTLPSVAQIEHRISPGDSLQLAVFREEALSGEFLVNEAGVLRLPLVGDIAAADKTAAEFRAELTARLSEEFVRDPNVAVSISRYRPVVILGEVVNPGQYVYSEGMTVHSLVARAGGYSFRARQNTVLVRHANEADERAYALTADAAVLPGDTVRIGARYF